MNLAKLSITLLLQVLHAYIINLSALFNVICAQLRPARILTPSVHERIGPMYKSFGQVAPETKFKVAHYELLFFNASMKI